MKLINNKCDNCKHRTFRLCLREVRFLKAEIKAKSEEAAAATLKARYLNGETVLSDSEIIDVEISNSRGVEIEVIDF